MPYISENRRKLININVEFPDGANSGDLNYVLTIILQEYLLCQKTINYSALSECVSSLECAKLEFTRRIVNLYEDTKIVENGDVYGRIISQNYQKLKFNIKDPKCTESM